MNQLFQDLQVKLDGEFHYDAMMKYVIIAISPVMAFATSEIKKPDAIFTYEFQNLVVMLLQIMDEKDRTYTKALNEIERVNKLIDEELED